MESVTYGPSYQSELQYRCGVAQSHHIELALIPLKGAIGCPRICECGPILMLMFWDSLRGLYKSLEVQFSYTAESVHESAHHVFTSATLPYTISILQFGLGRLF